MVTRTMSERTRAALLTAAIAFAAVVLVDGAGARAQQFSADIVVQADGGRVTAGRLRVLDRRTRIETPELADGFFLVDTTKLTAYFVRPGARVYMDARQSSQLTRLLVPVDPEEPCRQWQAMAELAGITGQGDWRCERTGEEPIGGRDSIVFRVISGSGETFVGWVDREHGFPLRIRASNGTVTSLENIKDEPQPASFFEISPNAKKFSPETLIERIKQSDVWVSDPQDGISHRQ